MSNIARDTCLDSTRDLPHSVGDLFTGWYKSCQKEIIAPVPFISKVETRGEELEEDFKVAEYQDLSNKEKRLIKWNMLIAGGNLLSDGYINGSTSTMSNCLKKLYGKQYTTSSAISNVSSIAFAGICFGQLFFTFYAMYFSRKSGLLLANGMLILFSILAAGAWTTNSSDTHAGSLFSLITVYRFFLGTGIGAEYPLGSSMGSDLSTSLKEGQRSRWFIFFTNLCLSFGFMFANLIPLILISICGEDHLQPVWRIAAGLGAIAPLFFFIARWRLDDSERYKKQEFKKTNIPYVLIFKFYWFRLLLLAVTWFAYDFASYGFGTYSSIILSDIAPHMSMKTNFGWNTLFNFVGIPGCFIGAFFTDYWGPRIAGSFGAVAQAIIGLAMAANLKALKANTTAFVACYCLFTAAGNFGFGNNIGYLCANSTSSNTKILIYAICAVSGKLGAFVATYIFPDLIKDHGGSDSISGLQQPYWVACGLALGATALFFFLFPRIDQASIEQEDAVFHKYLVSQGFDVSTLGHIYRMSELNKSDICDPSEKNVYSDKSEVMKKTENEILSVVEITESL